MPVTLARFSHACVERGSSATALSNVAIRVVRNLRLVENHGSRRHTCRDCACDGDRGGLTWCETAVSSNSVARCDHDSRCCGRAGQDLFRGRMSTSSSLAGSSTCAATPSFRTTIVHAISARSAVATVLIATRRAGEITAVDAVAELSPATGSFTAAVTLLVAVTSRVAAQDDEGVSEGGCSASNEHKEEILKHLVAIVLLTGTFLSTAGTAEARRSRVVVRGPRGHVVVRTGFPLHRTFPDVVVRTVPVRVAARTYLPVVTFTSVVVATMPASNVWSGGEELDRESGWTDFTMNVDRRGSRLLMQIADGPAQISFAEVVFENGDTQVVNFDDKTYRKGIYSVLDFKDGRKVDHVRVIARSAAESTEIKLHLAQ